MDKTFHAFDSPVRRQILVYLSDGDLSYSEIKQQFDVTGPATLYHLRTLLAGGLIRRYGPSRTAKYTLVKGNLVETFSAF
jgi:predicted transcriptional regulator